MTTQISLLLKTAAWVQILPALALASRRNLSRPVLLVAAAAAISFVGNYVGLYVAHRTGNNHLVAVVFDGITTSMFLLGFAGWQVTFVERLTLRLFILPFLATYLALILFVENTATFSTFTGPLYTLTILGASLWTLLRRSFQGSTPIMKSDWFWIAAGLALYGATTAVTQPIAAILMSEQRVDMIYLVWKVRAAFIDVAFVGIVAGVLTPPDPIHY